MPYSLRNVTTGSARVDTIASMVVNLVAVSGPSDRILLRVRPRKGAR